MRRAIITSSREYRNLEYAELILEDILNGKIPERELLLKIYPKELLYHKNDSYNKNGIEVTLDDFIGRESLEELRPIKSKKQEENTIFILKKFTDEDTLLNHMLAEIKSWGLPKKKDLNKFYKKYSKIVEKNFEAFQNLKITRSCDIPYINHLLGCSGMARYMFIKDIDEKKATFHQTLWALHDSPEELMPKLKKGNQNIYSINEIEKFMSDYIPEDMHEEILKINNVPKLVQNYLEERSASLKNVQKFISKLNKLKNKSKLEMIKEPIERMIEVTNKNKQFLYNNKTFLDELRMIYYFDIYLKDLTKNRDLYLAKGKVDLFDNLIGRHALDLDGRRRSVNKMIGWAQIGEEKYGKDKEFMKNINELKLIANYAAKQILIDYIAQPVAHVRHLESTLKNFVSMKKALYKNYAQSKNSISPS